MATSEPVENTVQSEDEKSEISSPVKEIEQNGQDGEADDSPMKEDTKEEEEEEEAGDEKSEEDDLKDEETTDEKQSEEKSDKQEEKKESAGSEEDSSDGEPQKGSLDGPVQLMTGKRERKKVDRLTMQSPAEKEKEKLEIKEGRGIKLADCPVVEFQLNKNNADVLRPLYRLFYGRFGKLTEIKKHIRKFSGFPFTREDTVECKKKEVQLNRLTTAGLKELCTWLALDRGGTKDEIINRLLDYCFEPTLSQKKIPVKKKRGAKKSSKKKKRKVGAKGDAKKKRVKKTKSDENMDDDDDDEGDDDEVGQDDDEDGAEEEEEEEVESAQEEVQEQDEEVEENADEESEEEEPPKKKAKKSATPKPAKKTKPKTPQRKASPKKSTKKTATTVEDSDSDNSSDDDAPLVKKAKSPPSESEIRSVIIAFLDGANLEQVTMKTVCKKVYETYPEFDLTPKKDFIKSTVKEIIST